MLLDGVAWDGKIHVDDSQGKDICAIEPVIKSLGEPSSHAGTITIHLNDDKEPDLAGKGNAKTAQVDGHETVIAFSGLLDQTGDITTQIDGTKIWLSLYLNPNDQTIPSIQVTTTTQFLTSVMSDLMFRWSKNDRPDSY